MCAVDSIVWHMKVSVGDTVTELTPTASQFGLAPLICCICCTAQCTTPHSHYSFPPPPSAQSSPDLCFAREDCSALPPPSVFSGGGMATPPPPPPTLTPTLTLSLPHSHTRACESLRGCRSVDVNCPFVVLLFTSDIRPLPIADDCCALLDRRCALPSRVGVC